ncbi:MAG: PepSY-associated TM helix domain-containing protein [Hyphomonadaceae bacterium]
MSTAETRSAPGAAAAPARKGASWKAFALRQFIQWHWISAAISLVGMILFAVTGITLNHAADISTEPVVREQSVTLPQAMLDELDAAPARDRQPLPPAVSAWMQQTLSVTSAGHEAEWSDDEVYLAIARPGGNSVISIDRASGEVAFEDTWRGWIAYLNDLHKGRDTGVYWSWFIDIFAGACVLFCVTGLGLLWLKAPARPSTWPLIGLGVIVPLLLAVFLIH